MAEFQDLTVLTGGVVLPVSTANVNDTTPTLAELTAAFPGLVEGQIGVIKDNAGATISFLTWTTNGTNRFWLKGTLGL